MPLNAAPDAKLAAVKWRVDSKPMNGRARFLPYLDAYLVARMLDEWVGAENWSDTYEPAHGKGLWCHLSIRVGDVWVTKTDLGVPSNMEAEKGLVSDAFKRAGSLKWGVGGNVYRLPNVWAPVDTKKDKNGGDVAFPNAQTIPAIIAELKKRGFSDADAGGATSDHDDDDEPTAEDEPKPEPSTTGPTFLEFFNALSPAEAKRLMPWLRDMGHKPPDAPADLIDLARGFLRDVEFGPHDRDGGDGASGNTGPAAPPSLPSRSSRAEQVAAESGLGSVSRAQQIADEHARKREPDSAQRAAGEHVDA